MPLTLITRSIIRGGPTTVNTSLIQTPEVTDNWLGGGGCTVNVAQKASGPIRGLHDHQPRDQQAHRGQHPVHRHADAGSGSLRLIKPHGTILEL